MMPLIPSAKRYRILLVLAEFPPHFGGMQTHAVYLSHYLAKNGYNIEILTYQSTNRETSRQAKLYDESSSVPIHRTLSRISFWHNIHVIAKMAGAFKPNVIYASNVYYGLTRQYLSIPVVCRSVGNDLLRPWIAYPFLFGSRLVSHPKFESIVYEWFKTADYPDWVEAAFRYRRFLLVYESIKRLSCIFANSLFTANILQQMGAADKNIKVLTGGVDSKRFSKPQINGTNLRNELRLPSDGFLIMTACRLVPKKGLDFLLQVFGRIKTFISNAYLVIVGDGKDRIKCENLANDLSIANNTIFTGYVHHSHIHKYYWSCDLFVLASRTCYNRRTGTKDVETMGRVLCEANAAGIPIVASNSGGIPRVVDHEVNGLLFEEDNTEDFLRQVLRLRVDKCFGRYLVENGRRKAREQFDWSLILKEHETILTRIGIQA